MVEREFGTFGPSTSMVIDAVFAALETSRLRFDQVNQALESLQAEAKLESLAQRVGLNFMAP